MNSDLYRELILEHYRHPKNYGEMVNPDFKVQDSNPLCGDEIEIQVKLDAGERIEDIKFNGKGCAISRASASMLTETVKGKSVDEIKSIKNEEILGLLGIQKHLLNAARTQCAILPLRTLKKGIRIFVMEHGKDKKEPSHR